MSFSSYQRTFGIGATNVVVGVSAVVTYQPDQYVNGYIFYKSSGSGSVYIQNSSSDTIGTGELLEDKLEVDGPGTLFLSATGSSAAVRIIESKSARPT